MEDLMTRNIVNGLDLSALGKVVDDVRADAARGIVGFRVKTRWTGQTRSETLIESYEFGGEQIDRRFKIVADEPVELMGQNSAPNPQELLMTALNACMMVGYVANAALHGIELTSVEIDTHGQLDLRGFLGLDDAVAPGYRQLDYTVRIAGPGTAEQFQAIHQAVMKTSPNFFNLNQPIRMNGRLEII
ncbi:osmotically inducible protein C [Sphingomonas sp. DBB INV C78]|uniref:OsmC family protein n=1 Tax=Sphingomonas sp. DBB INV C78 TaxID=3349434 RepID=UPI0036D43334